jgi:hypothetical protein
MYTLASPAMRTSAYLYAFRAPALAFPCRTGDPVTRGNAGLVRDTKLPTEPD